MSVGTPFSISFLLVSSFQRENISLPNAAVSYIVNNYLLNIWIWLVLDSRREVHIPLEKIKKDCFHEKNIFIRKKQKADFCFCCDVKH